MKKGLLIIISGPSGVGKGTVRNYFMNDASLKLAYSISMTTRSPRAGEQDGVDYIFTTKEKFEEAIQHGELLEWAEFVGNYYGTPMSQVEKLRNEGKNVLLEIEVQGATQVKEKCPDALTIFIHRVWKNWKIEFAVVEVSQKRLYSSVWRKLEKK